MSSRFSRVTSPSQKGKLKDSPNFETQKTDSDQESVTSSMLNMSNAVSQQEHTEGPGEATAVLEDLQVNNAYAYAAPP